MATNPIGEGKAVVSASVPKALADEIARRAGRLKWTKSKYAGELLEKWFAEGCPAVSDADAAVNAMVYQIPNDGSKTATKPVEGSAINGAALGLQALKDRAAQEAPPQAGKATPARRK